MDVHQQLLMDVAVLLQLREGTPALVRVLLDQLEVVALRFLWSDAVCEVIRDHAMERVEEVALGFLLSLLIGQLICQGLADKL